MNELHLNVRCDAQFSSGHRCITLVPQQLFGSIQQPRSGIRRARGPPAFSGSLERCAALWSPSKISDTSGAYCTAPQGAQPVPHADHVQQKCSE